MNMNAKRAGRRRMWAKAVTGVGLVVLALALLQACSPSEAVRVIAVGDMACGRTDPNFSDGAGQKGECAAKAVSDEAIARTPQLLLGLGDYQYEVASKADYEAGYAPTWGRLRDITRPALGNQELKVNKASTFYEYFGEVAPELPGYYSYDEGDWHMVVLNTNCTVVEGGCGPDSPQLAWLEEDLAENAGRCILAYGHHPRWSNGIAGPNNLLDPFYSAMVKGGVSLYLSGHESNYERFPPLDAAHLPSEQGVRQFVVGTGGQSLYDPAEGDASWRDAFEPIASEYFDASSHGFLELVLDEGSYSWQFITAGGKITDKGFAECRK